jgi:hypothetical protein
VTRFFIGVYRSYVEIEFFNIKSVTYTDSALRLLPCTEFEASRCLENGLLFMEIKKQKSDEERTKEQSASETVCFAWRSH